MLNSRPQTLFALLLIFGLALGGCASTQKFEAKDAAAIRKVAVLSVPAPAETTVYNIGSPAALIGGIGAGVAVASSQAKYREPLGKLAREARFDFAKEMQAALVASLRNAGYEVSVVDAKRESPFKHLEDYATYRGSGADAVLDLAIGPQFGYANVSMMDREYRPYVLLKAKLADLKTGKIYYTDQVMFGYKNPFMGGTQLPAEQQYFFKEPDDIIASKQTAIGGLRAGVKAIAEYIGAQLQRP